MACVQPDMPPVPENWTLCQGVSGEASSTAHPQTHPTAPLNGVIVCFSGHLSKCLHRDGCWYVIVAGESPGHSEVAKATAETPQSLPSSWICTEQQMPMLCQG